MFDITNARRIQNMDRMNYNFEIIIIILDAN